MFYDLGKKLRYVGSAARGRLVHTNLQILYACNFKCKICDFHEPAYRDRPRLTLEQARIVGKKLADVGPQIVSIGGGEPLLHPDLVPIVETLARDHFPVMICNGWYVAPEIARRLWQAGMYEISISVDYAEREKHDAQRGVEGAFDKAMAALRSLHEQRQHPWQRVHMITVVMDDNLEEIETLIEKCADMGITFLVTLYCDRRGELARRTTRGDFSGELLRLKSLYPSFVQLRGYLERFTEAITGGGVGNCYAGKYLCNVDSQGDVTLCIDRLNDRVGNILTDDMVTLVGRLEEMWRTNDCADCWTSCRGTIETLRHGRRKLRNLFDYYQLTRSVAVGGPTSILES